MEQEGDVFFEDIIISSILEHLLYKEEEVANPNELMKINSKSTSETLRCILTENLSENGSTTKKLF